MEAQKRQNLDVFYKDIFPAEQIFSWTQFGETNPTATVKREYAVTVASPENTEGAFVRYNACSSPKDLRALLTPSNQYQWVDKLDIGPVFSGNVSRHMHTKLSAEEKELVFDIDMDDYNQYRSCCQDKKVCPNCFQFLSGAAVVLNDLLTGAFGFKHILFVFSGRRGIHCWVSDGEARHLTLKQREGLVRYLSSGLNEHKKLKKDALNHPLLQHAFAQLEPHFIQLFETQNFFSTSKRRKDLIDMYFDRPEVMYDYQSSPNITPLEAWQAIRARAKEKNQFSGIQRIVLDYIYPRLDVEVSKHVNHLLKSPFCIHPATGKVCVPLTIKEMETFNPDTVPTLTTILQEYHANAHKTMTAAEQQREWENAVPHIARFLQTVPPTAALNTSLRPYIIAFSRWVVNLIIDERKNQQDSQFAQQLATGDW